MDYLMVVEADTNDGDYVHSHKVVSEEGRLKVLSAVQSIRESGEDQLDYDTSPEDMYGEEVVEVLEGHVPSGENGCHTLESIKFYPLAGVVENISVSRSWNNIW